MISIFLAENGEIRRMHVLASQILFLMRRCRIPGITPTTSQTQILSGLTRLRHIKICMTQLNTVATVKRIGCMHKAQGAAWRMDIHHWILISFKEARVVCISTPMLETPRKWKVSTMFLESGMLMITAAPVKRGTIQTVISLFLCFSSISVHNPTFSRRYHDALASKTFLTQISVKDPLVWQASSKLLWFYIGLW